MAKWTYALSFGFLFLLGCGKQQTTWRDQVSSCSALSADQQGTFMAPVPGTVRLMVDDTFTADQLSSIHAMMLQWNQLGQTLQGSDFFSMQVATVPGVLRTGNFQSCSIDPGTYANSFYLVNETYTVEKVTPTHWTDMGFSNLIPGATVRCYQSDALASQVVMIRGDLVDSTQFTSVVLHELGHSIGLDHSCKNGVGTADFISCSELPAKSPYRDAVMYPTLGAVSAASASSSSSSLAVKDQIQSNDSLRTGCLY